MENLKYSIFDLFAYALPGAFFYFCICCIGSFDITNLRNMINLEIINREVKWFEGTIYIMLSYITGFILTGIGNMILKVYLKIYHLFNIKNASSTTKSMKYAVVREKSKQNQKYIEQWNVLKNFSCSLATVLTILSILFVVKFPSFSWIHLIIGITISILLIIKAAEYRRWAENDLDNAYTKATT